MKRRKRRDFYRIEWGKGPSLNPPRTFSGVSAAVDFMVKNNLFWARCLPDRPTTVADLT